MFNLNHIKPLYYKSSNKGFGNDFITPPTSSVSGFHQTLAKTTVNFSGLHVYMIDAAVHHMIAIVGFVNVLGQARGCNLKAG